MTKNRKKIKDLLQDGVRPRAALDWLCPKAVCFVDWAHTSFSPRESSEVSPRGGSCGTATDSSLGVSVLALLGPNSFRPKERLAACAKSRSSVSGQSLALESQPLRGGLTMGNHGSPNPSSRGNRTVR